MYSKVIQLYFCLLFQILFPFRLSKNTEQCSLCYTVGWLSVLNTAAFMCQSQTPNLSLLPQFQWFLKTELHEKAVLSFCSYCKNESERASSFLPNFPAAAAAKSLQSCLTLWDPVDSSPPGSPVPGIFQERTLEWVAISFSNACKWKVKVKSLSHVRLLATPWTAAHQAPPPMGVSRQEDWSGVPLPSPLISP